MSRNDLTRHWRSRPWRLRAVWLALTATGLATAAFAAVDFDAHPDAALMGRVITRQRVAAGQSAQAPARVRQDTPLTPDQMFAAAATAEVDMTRAVEHGESLRVHAYRSRDIIRMTCVDEKLGQIKEIMYIAKPRFTTIKVATDELQMRSQFTTIREGWERVTQLAAEMEDCMGDSLGAVGMGRFSDEENGPGAAVDDPTLPPNPTIVLERPSYASPYQ